MKIIFSAFIIFLLANFAKAESGGNSVGNGGDASAEEFVESARKCVQYLNSAQLDSGLSIIVSVIENHIGLTQVNSTENDLWLRGTQVDAINYPEEHKIIINRKRWQTLKLGQVVTRMTLVLHEYLGVAGFDDGKYEISQKLIEIISAKLSKNSISLQRFQGLVGAFRTKTMLLKMDIADLKKSLNTPANLQGFCSDTGAIDAYSEMSSQIILENLDWFAGHESWAQGAADSFNNFAKSLNQQCFTQVLDLDKDEAQNEQISYLLLNLLLAL